jgi:outer membrane receptor for ferrienterochelin and colicin
MIKRYLAVLMVAALVMPACQTSHKASDRATMGVVRERPDFKGQRQLIDYLRTTPGVEVRGGGSNLLVLVRGAKSITGNNNPLYVVDGVIMGYDYYQAASAADRFMIDKVVVLPPPRSARYGSQGQNGVVEVTTRKTL